MLFKEEKKTLNIHKKIYIKLRSSCKKMQIIYSKKDRKTDIQRKTKIFYLYLFHEVGKQV